MKSLSRDDQSSRISFPERTDPTRRSRAIARASQLGTESFAYGAMAVSDIFRKWSEGSHGPFWPSFIKSTHPQRSSLQGKLDKYTKRVDWVSHAIVINVHYDEKGRVPQIEESNAVACAVQNLWLAMTQTDDIRGYWSTGSLVYTDDLAFWLGLQDNEKCMGIFYLGKLKDDAIQAHSKRVDVSEKTIWID